MCVCVCAHLRAGGWETRRQELLYAGPPCAQQHQDQHPELRRVTDHPASLASRSTRFVMYHPLFHVPNLKAECKWSMGPFIHHHTTIQVPNQYEAELLAECASPITSIEEGLAACDTLHAQGPHTVVRACVRRSTELRHPSPPPPPGAPARRVHGGGHGPRHACSSTASSTASPCLTHGQAAMNPCPPPLTPPDPIWPLAQHTLPRPPPPRPLQIITSMNLQQEPGHVVLLASTRQPQDAGPRWQRLALKIPKINAYFTGTGACCVCCVWLGG